MWLIRKFWKDVEDNTAIGRKKFERAQTTLENDMPKSIWMTVLNEEIGKLNRCCNKLLLASDPQVREQWEKEGYHKILTCSSVLRRLAEKWPDVPDRERSSHED
jgi:hypothetical protein